MKLIIKKIISECNRIANSGGHCRECLFTEECYNINNHLTPCAWNEKEYNMFCEIMLRSVDNDER